VFPPCHPAPMYTLPTRSTPSRPTRPYTAPVPRVQSPPHAQTPAGNGVHLLIISMLRSAPHTHPSLGPLKPNPPLATASIC
jgi:hypothetical protein